MLKLYGIVPKSGFHCFDQFFGLDNSLLAVGWCGKVLDTKKFFNCCKDFGHKLRAIVGTGEGRDALRHYPKFF